MELCVCVFWGVSLFMAKRNNFHFKRIYRPRLMLIPILLFLICHFGPLPSATSVILFQPGSFLHSGHLAPRGSLEPPLSTSHNAEEKCLADEIKQWQNNGNANEFWVPNGQSGEKSRVEKG